MTWLTYQDAEGNVIYGGEPMGPAPVSQPYGPTTPVADTPAADTPAGRPGTRTRPAAHHRRWGARGRGGGCWPWLGAWALRDRRRRVTQG